MGVFRVKPGFSIELSGSFENPTETRSWKLSAGGLHKRRAIFQDQTQTSLTGPLHSHINAFWPSKLKTFISRPPWLRIPLRFSVPPHFPIHRIGLPSWNIIPPSVSASKQSFTLRQTPRWSRPSVFSDLIPHSSEMQVKVNPLQKFWKMTRYIH